MKTIIKTRKINLRNDMFVLAVDVSKDDIHWIFQSVALVDEEVPKHESPNNTAAIRELLKDCLKKTGLKADQIVVACEPTGGYHKKLSNNAKELGMQTVLVSGKVVHKLEGVEANDNGKSDDRDPRVIFKLVLLKAGLLTDRHLPEHYARLRELHEEYDFASSSAAELRCRLHPMTLRLFPDFSFENDFIKSPAGQAFFYMYGFNPWKAQSDGESTFRQRMETWLRESKRRVRQETLDRLWQDICATASGPRPPADLLKDREQHVGNLIHLLNRYEAMKAELKRRMEEIYAETKEAKTLASVPLQNFEKAKVIAETGPLDDYQAARQLLRMGGLAIRIRESGTYKGLSKITKTGRPLMRKVLYQIVFADLGKNKGLFFQRAMELKGDGQKNQKKRTGKKRMIQFMRKLLTAIFAVHKSRKSFSQERLFKQEKVKSAA